MSSPITPKIRKITIRYGKDNSWPTYIFANLLRAGVVAITGYKAYTNMPDYPFFALSWLLFAGALVLPQVKHQEEDDEDVKSS